MMYLLLCMLLLEINYYYYYYIFLPNKNYLKNIVIPNTGVIGGSFQKVVETLFRSGVEGNDFKSAGNFKI